MNSQGFDGGRIDSLGLDENGAPVVVEFKRGTAAGVINQGLYYMAWLMAHKDAFRHLVRDRLGVSAASQVLWSAPRLICVAGDFTRYDAHAVREHRRSIDLVRYRIFDGGLLGLLLVESAPGSFRPALARRQRREREEASDSGGEVGKPSRPVVPSIVPACLQDLYAELDEALTTWGEVEVAPLRHYIAYRRMVNLAKVIFRPKHEVIVVYLRVDPDTVELEEGFSRDMRGIGHLGTGDLEVRISSASDLEKAGTLIRRAFEAA
ncbi:DUF5655 domain-containing protein [Streptomyces sp. NPDC054884]